MKLKKACPKALAEDLLERSTCAVQVAAVLVDATGIFSWGWNSAGPKGLGEHAEVHCVRRANRVRLRNSTLYVAAKRKRSGKSVLAKPCLTCHDRACACGIRNVVYRQANGTWKQAEAYPRYYALA